MWESLKKIFLTESGHPFIITGSGTIAMEAAVLSLLEPNDDGLILDTGYFAQRFVEMLSCYDIKSNVLSFEFGKHADPDKLKQELKNYNPTAGCVALKKKDFLILLKLINKKTKIKIY